MDRATLYLALSLGCFGFLTSVNLEWLDYGTPVKFRWPYFTDELRGTNVVMIAYNSGLCAMRLASLDAAILAATALARTPRATTLRRSLAFLGGCALLGGAAMAFASSLGGSSPQCNYAACSYAPIPDRNSDTYAALAALKPCELKFASNFSSTDVPGPRPKPGPMPHAAPGSYCAQILMACNRPPYPARNMEAWEQLNDEVTKLSVRDGFDPLAEPLERARTLMLSACEVSACTVIFPPPSGGAEYPQLLQSPCGTTEDFLNVALDVCEGCVDSSPMRLHDAAKYGPYLRVTTALSLVLLIAMWMMTFWPPVAQGAREPSSAPRAPSEAARAPSRIRRIKGAPR